MKPPDYFTYKPNSVSTLRNKCNKNQNLIFFTTTKKVVLLQDITSKILIFVMLRLF